MNQTPSRILVVDDEPMNRNLVVTLLRKSGYAYDVASGGREAIEKATTSSFDLILLDVLMPGIDGYETCRLLKEAGPAVGNVPVIMVTTLNDRESLLKALESGVTDFLTKPIDAAELMLRVRNAVTLKRYQDSLSSHIEMLQSEIRRRERAEAEKEASIIDLTDALSRIRTLSGLLPICASCKKIRDDRGYWNQIESYISSRSEAEFSHSICPGCAKRLYPEHYDALFPEEPSSK